MNIRATVEAPEIPPPLVHTVFALARMDRMDLCALYSQYCQAQEPKLYVPSLTPFMSAEALVSAITDMDRRLSRTASRRLSATA